MIINDMIRYPMDNSRWTEKEKNDNINRELCKQWEEDLAYQRLVESIAMEEWGRDWRRDKEGIGIYGGDNYEEMRNERNESGYFDNIRLTSPKKLMQYDSGYKHSSNEDEQLPVTLINNTNSNRKQVVPDSRQYSNPRRTIKDNQAHNEGSDNIRIEGLGPQPQLQPDQSADKRPQLPEFSRIGYSRLDAMWPPNEDTSIDQVNYTSRDYKDHTQEPYTCKNCRTNAQQSISPDNTNLNMTNTVDNQEWVPGYLHDTGISKDTPEVSRIYEDEPRRTLPHHTNTYRPHDSLDRDLQTLTQYLSAIENIPTPASITSQSRPPHSQPQEAELRSHNPQNSSRERAVIDSSLNQPSQSSSSVGSSVQRILDEERVRREEYRRDMIERMERDRVLAEMHREHLRKVSNERRMKERHDSKLMKQLEQDRQAEELRAKRIEQEKLRMTLLAQMRINEVKRKNPV
jgi:hypothetical protein